MRYASFEEVRDLRRVRWLATFVPVTGLILLGLFRHLVIDTYVSPPYRWVVETGILVTLAIIFSLIVVNVFERLQNDLANLYADAKAGRDRLAAVQAAGVALASDLALDRLLQRVVDLSRGIIGARYAALGVFGEDGETQQFIYSWNEQEQAHLGPPFERPDGSFLGVPVTYQSQPIGHLYLTDKESGDAFTESDREMAELFAAHAAVAIANARLYSQVQRLAVVEERQRIGMDLHDGTIQQLYAVGLTLESVIDMLDPKDAGARARLDRLADQLNQTIANIRHYIFDLRSEASTLSVPEALMQIASQLGVDSITRIDVQSDAWSHLSRDQTTALWHIAREILSNAARHGHPHHIVITVGNGAASGRDVQISFRDDGSGFDVQKTFDETHHGLRNMLIRARQHQGGVEIHSNPGKGTTVQVRFTPEENLIAEEDAE